jgi:hypothetical protein
MLSEEDHMKVKRRIISGNWYECPFKTSVFIFLFVKLKNKLCMQDNVKLYLKILEGRVCAGSFGLE